MRTFGDDVLVRRAARSFALQVAGLVALAIVLLVVLVTIALERGQTNAANALLRSTAVTADDPVDPPPGTWLMLVKGSSISSTPGLPAELSATLAQLRTSATSRPQLVNVSGRDGRKFRVATQQVTGKTVQVVLDLASEHQQRTRLLKATGMAAVGGLLLAGLLGVVLGRRAVRPLAEALALQRTFVADASHELRTPLTLLSTRAQVLDRAVQGSALEPHVLADSSGVLDDVRKLGEVVDDLLLAADPRADQSHQPVDLGDVVRAAVDSAKAHAQLVEVTLVLAPALLGTTTVLGSAPALRRATLALVDNAIDHTPPGSEVTVAVRRDTREVVVSVTDTGPGIAPGEADQVLRRFHSGGQRAGRSHYGLGLALTHDVANRHGGQLRLVQAGVGATFELVLPALG